MYTRKIETKKEDFIGWVLYSDLEQTGSLHTNHAKINQLISNSMWGQKSNFLDMPTDCPQRDERLGWTADAQVFSPTATYNMDTRAFYQKYLWDMRNIQKKMNGAVPAYLPQADGMCPVCSVWSDAKYYKELAAQIKDCLLYEYFTPAGLRPIEFGFQHERDSVQYHSTGSCIFHTISHTTTSTILFPLYSNSCTPASFFLLKLKLNKYPFSFL